MAEPPLSEWQRVFRIVSWSPVIAAPTVVFAAALILVVRPSMACPLALGLFFLYLIVDAALNVARTWWWVGSVVALVTGFVVMIILVTAAGARETTRDHQLLFLMAFLLFPFFLLVSGFVRLDRRRRGRSLESGIWIAAALCVGVCVLLIGGPMAVGLTRAMIQRTTGNTPRNTFYWGSKAEVVDADASHVTVRGGDGPSSYRLTPETRYGFLGPGGHPFDADAGPSWLKAGQTIEVSYFFRDHVACAERVQIWIDGKGCAGDAKWAAPMPSADQVSTLVGSTWEIWTESERQRGARPKLLDLQRDGGVADASHPGDFRQPIGAWRQKGAVVFIEVNNCYANYEATLDGEQMTGELSTGDGRRERWTARRITRR